MFRKKREEEYDEYNDRYSAKYDDDYIAPSEEYRSECDHDHEQTYSDLDTVAECDHDHEQTYSDLDTVAECDHDHEQTYPDLDTVAEHEYSHEQNYYGSAAEQRSYDHSAELERFFGRILGQGEKLIWAGSRNNVKPPPDNKLNKHEVIGKDLVLAGFILFFAGFCFIPLAILGMVLMLLGGRKLSKNNASITLYALTDRRVITVCNNNISSIALHNIIAVDYSLLGGDMGSVYITSNSVYMNGQNLDVGGYKMSFLEINEPARVEKLISETSDAVKKMMNGE